MCVCIIVVVLEQMTYESYAKNIQSSFANNSQELERNQMSSGEVNFGILIHYQK